MSIDIDDKGIVHFWTSENLASIVAGLDLKESDKVLAICGSGDQALAILEYAGKVEARDRNRSQLDFVKRRAELLRTGHYGTARLLVTNIEVKNRFPALQDEDSETKYKSPSERYLTDERLERIRPKLRLLELTLGNIFDGELNEANKIYLSNALTHSGQWVVTNLGNIARNLPVQGLIYVADSNFLRLQKLAGPEWDKPLLPRGVIIDKELTARAKGYDNGQFFPEVYRKVEEVK